MLNPTERWHKSMYDPACIATREAMKDVCRFWLDKGCDGFRVDMADSLVKHDDANKSGTVAVWQDILGDIHAEYPESAFVSEWGKAEQSIKAGSGSTSIARLAGRRYHHHLGNPATPYRTTGNTGQYQLTTVNYQPLIINCKE